MKRFNNTLTSFFAAVLVSLIGLSGVSSTALATAPSGSSLGISVTVTHSEDTEGTQVEPVYFTINLSPAPLKLTVEPLNQYKLEGEEIVYTYTAVSMANGPDTYNLSVQQQSPINVDGSIGSFVVTPNSLTLGVTAASGSVAVGDLEIPVPSDGVPDSSINGIEAGDTVYIHNKAHQVDAVEDESLEETSVIHLTEAHDSEIAVGDLISEGKTFELVISGVAILDEAEDALVGMTVTGASVTGDADAVANHDTLTSVYAPIPASTEHFVRNVSNPNGVGDPAYTATSGEQYYGTEGGLLASGDEILEYIIVQTAGNTGDLNDVVVTASMPLFTSYMGDSTFLNGTPQGDASEDPAQSSLIAGLNAGTIAINGKAEVTFQVKIDESSAQQDESSAQPIVLPSSLDMVVHSGNWWWVSTPEVVLNSYSAIHVSLTFRNDRSPSVAYPTGAAIFDNNPSDTIQLWSAPNLNWADGRQLKDVVTWVEAPSGEVASGELFTYKFTIDSSSIPSTETQFAVRPHAQGNMSPQTGQGSLQSYSISMSN